MIFQVVRIARKNTAAVRAQLIFLSENNSSPNKCCLLVDTHPKCSKDLAMLPIERMFLDLNLLYLLLLCNLNLRSNGKQKRREGSSYTHPKVSASAQNNGRCPSCSPQFVYMYHWGCVMKRRHSSSNNDCVQNFLKKTTKKQKKRAVSLKCK